MFDPNTFELARQTPARMTGGAAISSVALR
jgi:hypothetical protein